MPTPPPPIDAAFRQTISSVFGDKGRAWIDALPALLDEYATRWSLTLGQPFALSFNFVVAATRHNVPVVLKAGVPNPELFSEIAAMRLFNGDGAARVLETDADRGVMLLERVDPGTVLAEHWPARDDEATRIAARVMRRVWRPLPADHPFPTLERWTQTLERTAGDPARRAIIGEPLLSQALTLRRALLDSAPETVLLHGDLHHLNILASDRAGWLLIDPKGVAGERAYECASFLLNPGDWFAQSPDPAAIIDRRVAILCEALALDRARVLQWAFVHCVVSACWSIEDSQSFGDALDIAHAIAALFSRR